MHPFETDLIEIYVIESQFEDVPQKKCVKKSVTSSLTNLLYRPTMERTFFNYRAQKVMDRQNLGVCDRSNCGIDPVKRPAGNWKSGE